MIKERVYRLKEDAQAPFNVELKKNTELEIVMDIVYMGGYPLESVMQKQFYQWITQNPNLFEDTTKNWK